MQTCLDWLIWTVFTIPTHFSHDHNRISGIENSPANLKYDITNTVVESSLLNLLKKPTLQIF